VSLILAIVPFEYRQGCVREAKVNRDSLRRFRRKYQSSHFLSVLPIPFRVLSSLVLVRIASGWPAMGHGDSRTDMGVRWCSWLRWSQLCTALQAVMVPGGMVEVSPVYTTIGKRVWGQICVIVLNWHNALGREYGSCSCSKRFEGCSEYTVTHYNTCLRRTAKEDVGSKGLTSVWSRAWCRRLAPANGAFRACIAKPCTSSTIRCLR